VRSCRCPETLRQSPARHRVGLYRRQRDLEGCTLPWGGGDLEGSLQSIQALLDAKKAEASLAGLAQHVLDNKPYSVVA
jgi:hypothetical protein